LKVKVSKLRNELDIVNGLVDLHKKVYALFNPLPDVQP